MGQGSLFDVDPPPSPEAAIVPGSEWFGPCPLSGRTRRLFVEERPEAVTLAGRIGVRVLMGCTVRGADTWGRAIYSVAEFLDRFRPVETVPADR